MKRIRINFASRNGTAFSVALVHRQPSSPTLAPAHEVERGNSCPQPASSKPKRARMFAVQATMLRSFCVPVTVGLVMLFAIPDVRAITVASTNKPAASAPSLLTAAGAAPTAVAPPPSPSVTEDIRDIRPPFHIPARWLWMAWAAGGFALAAFGYGLWRWRRRLPGLRPKLAYELALEKLEAARRLMQPEHARAFSIEVSEVVRNYIEERFATRAAHRTTEEFLHDCAAQTGSPLAGHRPLLGDFLNHCDLAKFARWVLSVPEMEAMLASAVTFIRETGQSTAVSVQSPTHSARAAFSPHLLSTARRDAPDANPATEPATALKPAASTQ
jgi:hypothetical protein